ncbi:unnamed protein product [Toxocara canis]|uniref:Uncharacterized protein n=1 Tax=Toxocara canis TaxID=6265 RepID=A0A183UNK0_TOXCA|nr:unnamed protein product [Toxocara canis]
MFAMLSQRSQHPGEPLRTYATTAQGGWRVLRIRVVSVADMLQEKTMKQLLMIMQEYYLLCRRRSPVLKRRRLAVGQTRSMSAFTSAAIQPVACTAFVHVIESLSGWVSVRYCLEHCGHSSYHATSSRMTPRLRRSNDKGECLTAQRSSFGHLKRNSSSILNDSEDEDYASEECVSEESMEDETPQLKSSILDCLMEGLSSSGISCEPSSVSVSKKATVAERKAILGTIESELAAAKADVSSIKDTVSNESRTNVDALISERLESAVDRLRSLTKMLAELAIEIRAGNSDIATS